MFREFAFSSAKLIQIIHLLGGGGVGGGGWHNFPCMFCGGKAALSCMDPVRLFMQTNNDTNPEQMSNFHLVFELPTPTPPLPP